MVHTDEPSQKPHSVSEQMEKMTCSPKLPPDTKEVKRKAVFHCWFIAKMEPMFKPKFRAMPMPEDGPSPTPAPEAIPKAVPWAVPEAVPDPISEYILEAIPEAVPATETSFMLQLYDGIMIVSGKEEHRCKSRKLRLSGSETQWRSKTDTEVKTKPKTQFSTPVTRTAGSVAEAVRMFQIVAYRQKDSSYTKNQDLPTVWSTDKH